VNQTVGWQSVSDQVLYSFFTQIVIDTVDLGFIEVLSYLIVNLIGRLEVMTDRFFQNNAAVGIGAATPGQVSADRSVDGCGGCIVKDPGPFSALIEYRFQVLVALCFSKIDSAVFDFVQKPGQYFRLKLVCLNIFLQTFFAGVGEAGSIFFMSGDADDSRFLAEQACAIKLVKGCKEFALRKVTHGSEDDNVAGSIRNRHG
jgi:hypothetical protein